jgi:hypothetical protein
MKFTCIGFDIREWPALGRLTTEFDWERPEELYQKALTELKLEENSYQIIEIHNNEELQRLIDFTICWLFRSQIQLFKFLLGKVAIPVS